MKNIEQIARPVIFEHTPKVRIEYDRILEPEIQTLCDALDEAIYFEKKADVQLLKIPLKEQEQPAYCIAAIRKCLNDIFGSLELLRAGYFDLCHAALRSAVEGFAVAILINKDKNIFERYKERRYSVNKSIDLLARRNDLGISKKDAEGIKKFYERLHLTTHPTIASIALQFSPDGKGAFPVGGSFYSKRLSHYREVINSLITLTLSIKGFMQTEFLAQSMDPTRK